MKGWLFLVIAIVGEVIATSALKSSEGFTKLAPSAVVIIGYGIAFYFRCHNRLWHRILF
ncbi:MULTISPECIES: DMT family transporter, partial [Enterobacteriaceae]|uniref:DMT family transporter n=1 Tax=Enterobacteriaceae TaxID=543 RepID=UPI000FF744A5